MPLSTDLKPDGLQPLLDELEAKVLISSFRFERLLKALSLGLDAAVDLVIKQVKLSWDKVTVFSWDDIVNGEKLVGSDFYRTGDQGYMDEDGFFYIVGRQDDLIKVGGHRINLQET